MAQPLTCSYFLIPKPYENNLIYLFITQTPKGEIGGGGRGIKHSFVEVESLSILFSSKFVHVDRFIRYNGIMIEHY